MKRSERLAFMGEMASGMAHEVRNPLASISGSIQMLSQGDGKDSTNVRLMEIVLNETERLDGIITDFLSFAHPKPSNKELVDINLIIRETVELMGRRKDADRPVEFLTQLREGSLPAMVDPQELKQVLWNMCLNSMESMEDGGTLRVSTYLQDPPPQSPESYAQADQSQKVAERYVEIIVEDTGKGISRAELDKIFDPFYTTKEGGTGLGLAIAYRIVEKHDGYLDVESEAGKGTSMHIFLPVGDKELSGVGHTNQPEDEEKG